MYLLKNCAQPKNEEMKQLVEQEDVRHVYKVLKSQKEIRIYVLINTRNYFNLSNSTPKKNYTVIWKTYYFNGTKVLNVIQKKSLFF